MRVLTGYVGRIVAFRIVAVLLAFVALLVLMDMIDSVENVLDRRGQVTDIFYFVGYRLPTIVERLIPLSVLIGTTMGLLALATNSELIILRSSGLSPIRIAVLCIPVCLAVVFGHFLLADRVAPASEKAFISWWEPLVSRTSTQWFRGNDSIVRIGGISNNAAALTDVTIFYRDQEGRIDKRINAKAAIFAAAKWTLSDVTDITVSGNAVNQTEKSVENWPDGPDPTIILDLVAGPDQLSNGALEQILSVAWSSSAEPSVYRTALARRSVAPLTSLVMMLLAVSTIRGQIRSGGPQMGAALALVLGLTFLVVDGMFASLGRAGVIAPLFAAWVPILSFTGLAGILLLRLRG